MCVSTLESCYCDTCTSSSVTCPYGWVLSNINVLCPYEWVMAHICPYEWVMSYIVSIWMSYIWMRYINESCHTLMHHPHIWISYVTYEWGVMHVCAMTKVYVSYMTHVYTRMQQTAAQLSVVSCMCVPWLVYICVIWLMCISACRNQWYNSLW